MNHFADIRYSIAVLLEEESEDFTQFIYTIYEIFTEKGEPFEILIMANGTEGFLMNHVEDLHPISHSITFFTLNRKNPQSVCLNSAVKESNGDIIVICGSYQQLTKDSFISLLEAFDEETDIISPWRQERVDPSFNQLQSRVFNEFVRKIIGAKVHDLSCTVKLVRREVLEDVEIYGNMSRFLPILAARFGYKTKEIPCKHHQERGKTGFYSFSDYLTRVIDILNLYFNIRFFRKPLRFFGILGLSFAGSGFLLLLLVFLEKLITGYPIGNRPLLLMALLFFVIGIQTMGLGLLAEIVVFTQGRNLKEFRVSYIDSDQYSGPERRKNKYFKEHYRGDEKRKTNIKKCEFF